MSPQSPGLANWLRVIALSVIWGASFLNVSVALRGFDPLSVAALRIVIAALAITTIAHAMGIGLPRGRRVWLHAAGMGFFSNALPFSLLSWGQQHVASGFAGITMAAVPLFTMLLAHRLVPGERMTPLKLLGLGLGMAGVVTLIGPQALAAAGGAMEPLARLACVASTLAYAIGGIITRRCPPVPMIAFSAAALIAASAMIVPTALLVEGLPDPARIDWAAAGAVLYLGLLPTAVATLLLVKVIQTAGPTFLTQSNYQVPIWSVLFGTVFLDERLPAAFFAALGLILAGLAVSNAAAWRRRP